MALRLRSSCKSGAGFYCDSSKLEGDAHLSWMQSLDPKQTSSKHSYKDVDVGWMGHLPACALEGPAVLRVSFLAAFSPSPVNAIDGRVDALGNGRGINLNHVYRARQNYYMQVWRFATGCMRLRAVTCTTRA